MDRIEKLDDIHAVVFENYRSRIPLLERKVGRPVNAEGTDLWVLVQNHNRAEALLRHANISVNDDVTAERRHTYERHVATLPSNAAVMFSKDSLTDDDALMSDLHPVVVPRRQRFIWRNGTYYLSVVTSHCGGYDERETRIGRSDLTPDDFAQAVVKASDRLHQKSPYPFDDADGRMVVSQATASILSMLTNPAAAAVRHWLANERTDAGVDRFEVPSSALSEPAGISGVTLTRGPRRIMSRICYANGDALTDLGFLHKAPLPATVVHGLKGEKIDRVVAGGAIGAWTIRKVHHLPDMVHFDLDVPTVPLEHPNGAEPLDEHLARMRLAALLGRRFDMDDIGQITSFGPQGRHMLLGSMDVSGMLRMLPYEVSAYLIEQAMHRSVDLSPWLGQGELRRCRDKLGIANSPMSVLADVEFPSKDAMS